MPWRWLRRAEHIPPRKAASQTLETSPEAITDRDLFQAFIGAKWPDYRERFDRAAGGQRIQWNWEAALTPLWGWVWRLPLLMLWTLSAFLWVPELVRRLKFTFLGTSNLPLFLLSLGILSLGKGLFGTWLLYRRAVSVVAKARRATGGGIVTYETMMARAPGTLARQSDIALQALGSLLLSVCLLFIIGFARTYPTDENPSIVRSHARSILSELEDWQRRHYERDGVFSDTLPTELPSERLPVDLVLTEVTADGFRAVATGQRAPAECELVVTVTQQVVDEPTVECRKPEGWRRFRR